MGHRERDQVSWGWLVVLGLVLAGLVLLRAGSSSDSLQPSSFPSSLPLSGAAGDGTLAARLCSAETRVAVVEEALVEAAGLLASALGDASPWPSYTAELEPTSAPSATRVATWTPRPTWTLDPVLFTPTATTTPDPLCAHCSGENQRCADPANYFCKECASGKWRCVRRSFPASDCQVCLREGL